MADLDGLQAELLKITRPHIELVGSEIAQHIREGQSMPLRLLADEQRNSIALLAVYDPERFVDLQAELYAVIDKSRRSEVNLEKHFAKRIRDKKREHKTWEDLTNKDPSRGKGLPTREVAMAEMNQQFVHTFVGSNDMVMRTNDLIGWRPRSFIALHNDPVRTTNDKGEVVLLGRGEAWLDYSGRTLALDGLVCEPQEKPGIIRGINSNHFRLNTWQGTQLVPQEGDWTPMREVLDNVFPEKQMCAWAIKWLARTVQFPWKHGESALVLTGPHGAGKSTLVEFLKRVFPPRHCAVIDNPQRVFGRFNDHLRDLVVLVAEEAFFHGEPRNFNKLKNRITGDTLDLEIKNGAVFQAPNRISNIIISNDDFVVQTAQGDRRYAVSKANRWKQNDNIYWTAFYHHMDNCGGWAAMLHDLLRIDLSGFNHRLPPETEALRDQRRHTRAATPEAWIQAVLERGFWLRSDHGHVEEMHVWPEQIGKQLLMASQRQWLSDHRFGRHEVLNSWRIGELMRKLLDREPQRLTQVLVSESHQNDGGLQYQHREWGWTLPELDYLRQRFEEHVGDSIEWKGKIVTLDGGSDHDAEQNDYDEEPEIE